MLRRSQRSPILRILAVLVLLVTLGASTAFAAPTPGDRAQGLISQLLAWSADSLLSWWAPSGVPTGGTGTDGGTDDGTGGTDGDDGGAGGVLDPNGTGGDGTGGTGTGGTGTGGTGGTGTGGTGSV